MTLITRICLALVLAVTLSLTSLTSAAHAAVFSFPFSPSMSENGIASMAQAKSSTRLKDGGIAVINKTEDPLTLSGAYKAYCFDEVAWPLSTIPPKTVMVAELAPDAHPCFAANYQVGDDYSFVQFAVVEKSLRYYVDRVNNERSSGEYPARKLYESREARSSASNPGSFGNHYVSSTSIDLGFQKELFTFEVLY